MPPGCYFILVTAMREKNRCSLLETLEAPLGATFLANAGNV